MLPKIEFNDICFWIGENNLSGKLSVPRKDILPALKKNKSLYNISTAFLTDFSGLHSYPYRGNDMVSEYLKEIRVSGDSSVHMDLWGTMFFEYEMILFILDRKHIRDFENHLKNRFLEGFRILRLSPKSHKYPFEAALFKKVYEALAHHKFPVIISVDETDITGDKQIQWEKLQEIAERFPNLPLIIDGGFSKELMYSSYIFMLISNCDNIYFNTHNLFGTNQIEDIVKNGGEDRLVFDTYYPHYEAFVSTDRIMEADISSYQKEKIAQGNIKKILHGIEF
jgi:hypothetical protein